mmetsp:Transcript_12194/g.18849  ORF Transcript_12194/g.18849 Transcript_12194/m.18849 type:complete len:112 (-) Transcript_12194:1457-1792(-)
MVQIPETYEEKDPDDLDFSSDNDNAKVVSTEGTEQQPVVTKTAPADSRQETNEDDKSKEKSVSTPERKADLPINEDSKAEKVGDISQRNDGEESPKVDLPPPSQPEVVDQD